MTQGVELRFRQTTGSNPAQSLEPGIVKMPDGSERRVTLEIQVNGVWKTVDPKKNIPYQAIAKQCHQIYQTATQATDLPETLTVYFEQSVLESGTFFKQEVVDLTFKKIEYKTADSDKLHKIDAETHEFDVPKVNQLASEMKHVSKAIFGNREYFLEKPTKIKTKSAAEKDSEKLAAIKRTLNVQEAGSLDNRCLTLSIAAILLKKDNNFATLLENQFRIPLQEGDTPQITLSNMLIELAAHIIIKEEFTNSDACFDTVVAALKSAGQLITDESDRPAVAKQYADLIRLPGQMLDVPVLKALEMSGLPIIALVPSQGDLVLGSVSPTITFNEGLDAYDLTAICFVVHDRDGLHYQPVMMNETAAQQEKLRSILKNDMEKTLGQIQNLISDTQRELADKFVEFNNLVASVVNKYPFDAKPRIVQMLRSALRIIEEDAVPNDIFIGRAADAFLNPGPRI
jgi:hypothetical protein